MVTISPSHACVAEALIVGAGAFETFTEIGVETEEQPFTSVTVTVYEPEVVTEIVAVVALVDQRFPFDALEVKFTDPPVQNVVGPFAAIVGVAGKAFTVIVIAIRGLSSLLRFA